MIDATSNNIKKVMGSFWTQIWTDQKFLDSLTKGYAQDMTQLSLMPPAMYNWTGRKTVDTEKARRWQCFDFLQSELVSEKVKVGSFTVGDGTRIGAAAGMPASWSVPAPAESAMFLVDDPANPTIVWTKWQDFYIAGGRLYFYANPFEAGFPCTMILGPDGNPDVVCKAWLVYSEVPTTYLKDFFTAYLELTFPSSKYYRDLFNSIWDLLVEGGTVYNTNTFLARVADADICRADGIVTETWSENSREYVLAGSELYSCGSPGKPLVAAGDSITYGQFLFDSVTAKPLDGTVTESELPGLHLGPHMIGAEYAGGILLSNADCDARLEFVSTDGTAITYDTEGHPVLSAYGCSETYDEGLRRMGIVRMPLLCLGGASDTLAAYREASAAASLATATDLWYAIDSREWAEDDTPVIYPDESSSSYSSNSSSSSSFSSSSLSSHSSSSDSSSSLSSPSSSLSSPSSSLSSPSSSLSSPSSSLSSPSSSLSSPSSSLSSSSSSPSSSSSNLSSPSSSLSSSSSSPSFSMSSLSSSLSSSSSSPSSSLSSSSSSLSSSSSSLSSSSMADRWTANGTTLETLNPYLVAIYKYSSGAATTDSSGKGHTLTNTDVTDEASGMNGHCGSFNGTSSKSVAATSSDFNFGSGPLTIAGWIKGTGTNKYILTRIDGSSNGIQLFLDGAGKLHYYIGNAGWFLSGAVGSAINDNAWHLIGLTRVGNDWTAYVDNTSYSLGTAATAIGDVTTDLYIGTYDGSSYYFTGLLDEWIICKGKGATASEMTALWNSGTGSFWIP